MTKHMHKLKIGTLSLMIGLLIAAPALLVGCNDDRQTEKSFTEKVVDSVARSVAEGMDKARVKSTDSMPSVDSADIDSTPAVDLAVTIEDEDNAIPAVHDMVVTGSVVNAVFDGGLLVYDLKTDEWSVTTTGKPLRALEFHSGVLYAGGDKLYRVDSADLIPVEVSMEGRINVLHSYGPSLMVGTTDGLYARNLLGTISLLDSLNVTALTDNSKGLWIGTDGDGLYCWDGDSYRKRYLARDESLFDYVTSLDAGPNHVYLGTTDGLYVFDGGSWETISVDDGLPSGHVTSIDASNWVVYIGTTNGAVSFFDGDLTPVDRLDSQVITSVRKAGNRILAGTGQNGLVVKSGPAVRTITEPWESPADLAFLIH
ncbi:hypothetical protein GF377_00525 [candidate division GN15 bacterium]|nr:hypothetical protein [candidate division GN15 bacterium]